MSVDFREAMSSSISYWEPRRLVYNAVLALIVVAWFVAGWPGSKESLGTDLALGLFILAVLANVAYCAVYLPDLSLREPAEETARRELGEDAFEDAADAGRALDFTGIVDIALEKH